MYIFVLHKVGRPLLTRFLGSIGVGIPSPLPPSRLHTHTGAVSNSAEIIVIVFYLTASVSENSSLDCSL